MPINNQKFLNSEMVLEKSKSDNRIESDGVAFWSAREDREASVSLE